MAKFTTILIFECTIRFMNETSVDLSMACSPDIWELKMFLWTSANMPAWNDVLLEMNAPVLTKPGTLVEPKLAP
jgi:hypothetical protein